LRVFLLRLYQRGRVQLMIVVSPHTTITKNTKEYVALNAAQCKRDRFEREHIG